MPVLETLAARRLVASPAALDAAQWSEGTLVLRVAADEALLIGGNEMELADEHAIVVGETGFKGTWLGREELVDRVVPHMEWPLPAARPVFVQGLIAGVPAKLWLAEDRSLLLCAAAYAHELADRLG